MKRGKITTRMNGGLLLSEYQEGIRFGTDALLLASFAQKRLGSGLCADFGTGSGVLPLLLAGGCRARFLAVELQEKYAALARENVLQNGLETRVDVCCGDLREYRRLLVAGSCSGVICNPPYLPADCGRKNLAPEKRLAWHEDCLPVETLAAAAGWALQFGGRFFCVYLPSRLPELITALRAHALEPKRLRPVAPSASEKPSLVLLEAKKHASPGLEWLPSLFLYEDETHTLECDELSALYAQFGERNQR